MGKKKKIKKEEKQTLWYFDGIPTYDMTPEERDAELERLKEECDKLTEWPII